MTTAETYSVRRPTSQRRPGRLAIRIRGIEVTLRTDAGVFSPTKLDRGTELLLESLPIKPHEVILDLGCGYGVIGILAAKMAPASRVILTEVNERAVGLARTNVKEAGLGNTEVRAGNLYEPVEGILFHHIVSNPPLRAGRAVVDRIVLEAPSHLLEGGHLWLVARTSQGAEALRSRMEATFGNAEVVRRGSGYKVLRSTKQETLRR
jgi:16S rRNA (guanine1207-N2)-methyltransferase